MLQCMYECSKSPESDIQVMGTVYMYQKLYHARAQETSKSIRICKSLHRATSLMYIDMIYTIIFRIHLDIVLSGGPHGQQPYLDI